jgi:hypothetical protein
VENFIIKSFIICALQLILIMVNKAGKMKWAGHVDACEPSEIYKAINQKTGKENNPWVTYG